MKKLSILFLVTSLLALACKKDKANTGTQMEITILDRSTGMPLSGATVQGFKCNHSDWLGNCSELGQELATTTTNAEGKAFFSTSLGVKTFNIRKENYLDLLMPNLLMNPFSLVPAATLKVRFIKTNQYAASNQLYVIDKVSSSTSTVKALGLPNDAVVYLKGTGDEPNSVYWKVGTSSAPPFTVTQPVMISKFDTAAFTIRY